jgi:DNA invertase Pin-like site-specific DNA recombinase
MNRRSILTVYAITALGLVMLSGTSRRQARQRRQDRGGVECEKPARGSDALDRRPNFAQPLAAVKAAKCSVLVSKLDRLSRDVAFISGLMAQRVPFMVSQSHAH